MRTDEDAVGTRGGLDLRPGVLARCTHWGGCGWEGVPTYINGEASTYCPACQSEDDAVIEAELDAEDRVRLMAKAVGRNDPCPCGSGRKFKKCCLP